MASGSNECSKPGTQGAAEAVTKADDAEGATQRAEQADVPHGHEDVLQVGMGEPFYMAPALMPEEPEKCYLMLTPKGQLKIFLYGKEKPEKKVIVRGYGRQCTEPHGDWELVAKEQKLRIQFQWSGDVKKARWHIFQRVAEAQYESWEQTNCEKEWWSVLVPLKMDKNA